MTPEEAISGGARFRAFFRERDVNLSGSVQASEHGAVFAEDKSGGRFVVAAAPAEGEVWLLGSEGDRHRLAPSLEAFFAQLGRGFTLGDLIEHRAVPSGRAAPGVLRWLGL